MSLPDFLLKFLEIQRGNSGVHPRGGLSEELLESFEEVPNESMEELQPRTIPRSVFKRMNSPKVLFLALFMITL